MWPTPAKPARRTSRGNSQTIRQSKTICNGRVTAKNVFFEVEQGSVEGAYTDVQPRVYSVNVATGKPTRWAAASMAPCRTMHWRRTERFWRPECSAPRLLCISKLRPKAPFQKLDGWPGTYGPAATTTNSSRIAFTYSEVDKPTEVYIADSADKLDAARPITSFNKLFTERDLPKGKPFRWTSDDGTPVEGMLLYPPGKFEAKNLRLFVLIHGGPMDADGNYFGADWDNWSMYAASQGWLVFRPNYRGSAGYGDKFALAIVPKIVSAPGRDILSGVEALVKAGIANPNQMTIGGYSYGGYMTNWLITQTTEFKAAVTGAGAVEHIVNWGNDDTYLRRCVLPRRIPVGYRRRGRTISTRLRSSRSTRSRRQPILWRAKTTSASQSPKIILLEHALHALGIPSFAADLPRRRPLARPESLARQNQGTRRVEVDREVLRLPSEIRALDFPLAVNILAPFDA